MTDMPSIPEGPDMGGLLEQAMAMQRQMLETQQRLAVTEVTGEAGGGMVRVVMTGDFDVRSVHIDSSVVDPDDTELLADLVAAAFRNAVAEAIELQSSGMGAEMPDVGQLLEGLGGLGDSGGLGGLGGLGSLGGLGGIIDQGPGGNAALPEADSQ
jgi:DNA-binding YbaB/EbfC family protein